MNLDLCPVLAWSKPHHPPLHMHVICLCLGFKCVSSLARGECASLIGLGAEVGSRVKRM